MNQDWKVNGKTRLFGIIGDPITQVKTPEMMNPMFRAVGRDAVLIPIQVSTENFEQTMRGIMSIGNLDGLVVTVPHKIRALALVGHLDPTAEQVGAINIMRRLEDGAWAGAMFDGEGLVRGLKAKGFEIADVRVLQMGAGGSGSAVAMALAQAGAQSIVICDPEIDKAEALAARVRHFHSACAASITTDGASVTSNCDLLINCSPIGMAPNDGMPAPFSRFDPKLQVVDIIMHPETTPLLAFARECGCKAMNGRAMIEGQFQAFAAFFGV